MLCADQRCPVPSWVGAVFAAKLASFVVPCQVAARTARDTSSVTARTGAKYEITLSLISVPMARRAPSIMWLVMLVPITFYHEITRYIDRPWQCLNFLPEPHGHSAFRGVPRHVVGSLGSIRSLRNGVEVTRIGSAPPAIS